MGMSPSADLYWGFDLGDMTDNDWNSLKPAWMGEDGEEEEQDWEEVYAARSAGWVEAPFPDHSHLPSRAELYRKYDFMRAEAELKKAEDALRETPEYEAWSASRSRLREIIEQVAVKLDTYGYIDEPRYFVYVIASHQRADDYGDIALKPIIVDPAWRQQLFDFMKLMELPIPEGEEPGWHLNCSYG